MSNPNDGHLRRWFKRVRTIKRDWVFYSLAYIPFFIISFAVWICLDEAIFALRYRIVIQWSLFPYFRVFPDTWHYLGIILFVIGMIIMGITLLLHRTSIDQQQIKTEQIYWFQVFKQLRHWFSLTAVLVVLGLIGLLSLGIALGIIHYAFTSQIACTSFGYGIPCFTNLFGIIIETLYLHQIGNLLVAIGLALIFIVVIRERSED